MRIFYARYVLLAILVTCDGSSFAQSLPKGTNKPSSSIVIKAFNESVKTGSPIDVIVSLRNDSDHDIVIERFRSGADSRVDVRDMNDKLVPDTGFGYLRNGHVSPSQLDPSHFSSQDLNDHDLGTVILKPGQAAEWDMDVGRFYDMSQPGKYKVRIERPDPSDPKANIKSNTVTVTVTP